MIRNIGKYFLFFFFFVFTLSLVNISPLFAKKEKEADKTAVDTDVCKRDTTKTGAEQYSAKCKEQCTSTDTKFAQFKKDNKEACDTLAAAAQAAGSGSGSGTGSGAGDGISDTGVKSADTITKEQEIENLVQNVVEKLNTIEDTTTLEAIIPDFTSQALKYQFTLTFSAQLRDALQEIIFAKPATTPTTTASYNVLNEDTKTAADNTAQIKERAVAVIKAIILKSFDPTPTDASKYHEEVIKELRDDWLNVDLKGDATKKDTPFTVANFKLAISGTAGYSLPHELYHFDFDEALKKAIDTPSADDTATKTAFIEAYKNYVSKNIQIVIKTDTWEEAKPLEFTISLNADVVHAQLSLQAIEDKNKEIASSKSTEADKEIASSKSTEADSNKATPVDLSVPAVISDDLSTTEAFDKIKKVFDVTVEEIPADDLGFDGHHPYIQNVGLVPVRVIITPKDIAPDAAKPALEKLYDKILEGAQLKKLKKLFFERIIALADKTPTTLNRFQDGIIYNTPFGESLYDLIYKKIGNIYNYYTNLKKVITKSNNSITLDNTRPYFIRNYKVIVVKKPLKTTETATTATKIDILAQANIYTENAKENAIVPFEKLLGVEVSYAHIAYPAALGADFVAQTNFKKGLFGTTTADTPCDSFIPDKKLDNIHSRFFATILNNNPGCRNLLKITVPTSTTAEFGIPDGPVFSNTDTSALALKKAFVDNANAARDTILFIYHTFGVIAEFTTHFNPELGETDAHYIYASDAIKNQLRSAKNLRDFLFLKENTKKVTIDLILTHNWPASEHVQAALNRISNSADKIVPEASWHTVSLFRVIGDEKSVYLTKAIIRSCCQD